MAGSQTIEGLMSNLDITSIVNTIITAERQPVTLLEADKALRSNQVAAYQAALAKFLALKTNSALLMKESSFNKTSINVSDETVLSATASERVAPGTYNLRVLSLARNHQLATQGFDNASASMLGTGTIKLSVGNASQTTLTIDSSNNSLLGIKNAINNAHIGITASIINDGTTSKSYRLLLTSDKTGAVNDINSEISLSGGEAIDLTNSSFDVPEELSFSTGSTSNISLGSTATYTGNQNKTYTFTIGGSGAQTIGSDNITINWSDGTNSGSILATQSDTEYELTGAGSEGLKLTFSAGDLVAGDTFQVQTFAPLLQAASDAQIAIGADSGNPGSAIVINSATNEFDTVIPGMEISVKKISEPSTSVTIKTDIDTAAVKQMISDYIDRYNDVMKFVDEQNTYNTNTKEAGVLFSDFSLQVMQTSLRSATTSIVSGLQDGIKNLAAIGIRSDADGRLTISNSALLLDSIKNDYDNVIKLFTDSGESNSSMIEFLSAGQKTVAGKDFDIEITQAATQGSLQGATIADPSASPLTLTDSNNVLKFRIDGIISSDLVLSARTYNSGEELANEIQTRINADSKINSRGINVEWVDLGNTGYLKITGGSYGSKSKVEIYTAATNTAYNTLGLSGGLSRAGIDVAGTINGETATGSGQILTGNKGNHNTEDLKLKVTLTSHDIMSGAEGIITVAKGLASQVDKTLDSITKSIDGSIARRVSALNDQIENLTKQIDDYDKRLAARKEDLLAQFNAMEEALAQYKTESSYLTSQLSSLTTTLGQTTSTQ